ncbi:hypothetical protein [Streptomyces sp. NPDC054834]
MSEPLTPQERPLVAGEQVPGLAAVTKPVVLRRGTLMAEVGRRATGGMTANRTSRTHRVAAQD